MADKINNEKQQFEQFLTYVHLKANEKTSSYSDTRTGFQFDELQKREVWFLMTALIKDKLWPAVTKELDQKIYSFLRNLDIL